MHGIVYYRIDDSDDARIPNVQRGHVGGVKHYLHFRTPKRIQAHRCSHLVLPLNTSRFNHMPQPIPSLTSTRPPPLPKLPSPHTPSHTKRYKQPQATLASTPSATVRKYICVFDANPFVVTLSLEILPTTGPSPLPSDIVACVPVSLLLLRGRMDTDRSTVKVSPQRQRRILFIHRVPESDSELTLPQREAFLDREEDLRIVIWKSSTVGSSAMTFFFRRNSVWPL